MNCTWQCANVIFLIEFLVFILEIPAKIKWTFKTKEANASPTLSIRLFQELLHIESINVSSIAKHDTEDCSFERFKISG